jgi:excisionase family DNA binding protein
MAPNTGSALLLRIPEAAERLALSRAMVYLLIQRGELPTVHIGRSIRVPAAALEQWVTLRLKESSEVPVTTAVLRGKQP